MQTQIGIGAWGAKNSPCKQIQVRDIRNLPLWKTSALFFTLAEKRIASIVANVEQAAHNTVSLSKEKSLFLMQSNKTITATLLKTVEGEGEESIAISLDIPSNQVAIVLIPKFKSKSSSETNVLTVSLLLEDGTSSEHVFQIQVYSKHSGTRSKLLLHPKKKSAKKSDGPKPSRALSLKNTKRQVTVRRPVEKKTLRKRNNARMYESDTESDSESGTDYEDGFEDEEEEDKDKDFRLRGQGEKKRIATSFLSNESEQREVFKGATRSDSDPESPIKQEHVVQNTESPGGWECVPIGSIDCHQIYENFEEPFL